MQMTLPGVACVYYGQEIGMTDINPIVGDRELDLFIIRDRSKAPMQWDDTLNAGKWSLERRRVMRTFKTGTYLIHSDVDTGFTTSADPWLPMQRDYRQVNVKLQKKQPDSPLNRFKILSSLRQTPTMQLGELRTFVLTKWVYAFIR